MKKNIFIALTMAMFGYGTQMAQTATITKAGDEDETPDYGIILVSETDTLYRSGILCGTCTPSDSVHTVAFDTIGYGYGTPPARQITIINSGKEAIGELTIALSEADSAFFLSKTEISGIAVGNWASFTMRPKTGLDLGTYTATVTVSGHEIEAGFYVSFTVDKAAGARVDTPKLANVTHESITVYPVARPSNGQEVEYAIDTTNTATELKKWQSQTLFGGLKPSTTYYVYARSKDTTNYKAGDTLSVSDSIPTKKAPEYNITLDILLDETGTYSFDSLSPKTVRIKNTGTKPTGALTVVLSDTNRFSLPITFINSIDPGQTAYFTVQPKTGLAGGTYTATVTVKGGNNINESFNVKFTVKNPVNIHDGDVETWRVASLQAWTQNNVLYIKGLSIGKPYRIYTVSGTVVHQGVATADVETWRAASLYPRGIYIIHSENKSIKIMKNEK